MTKRWQVRGAIQQFHADQYTVLWKAQRVAVGESPKRDVFRCVRGIGQTPSARIETGSDDKAECSAEGMGGAEQCPHIGRFRHTFDANAEIAA